MDQDNPNGFVESERGIILNEPLPEERRSPVEPAPKPPKKHEKKIVGFLLFLLVAGAVAFAATQIDYTAISDTIAGSNYKASDDLEAIIEELELTDAGMRILKATRPELQDADDFNQNCVAQNQNSAVLGCYKDGRIYIYNIQRQELNGIRQATLAHELLHAVWSRLSGSERNGLAPSLRDVLKNDGGIQKSMKNYDVSSPDDELHSRVGTQVVPEKLPESLRAHYKKYFKNLSKISALYSSYNTKFEEIDANLKALKAEIKERHEVCATMKKNYESAIAKYNNDYKEYNERRRTPGGYATQAEHHAAYEALVDSRAQLLVDYEALMTYISKLNDLVNEYNRKAIYANDLQHSIDSSSVKQVK